ncbi:Type I restriction-modification system S subunit [Desulfamplus magnetovallimortis]|uniref:Type I restriction-modification system S subunit n=1 Tax=Desulfamplus magnetovallimortis TaxID=1246637 RepID=A0A1W1HAJ3_9BACT|nr:restriction endonuclease subunit S [Desulfamplus magnetovallimortis]SLM29497.1 Type I restriction-modification system S subunit [Desulfamplus magnetovallimortis]
MEAYPKYKDSGVPWLGCIPEHWTTKPGHAIYKEKLDKNIGLIEKRILSLSYGKIIIKPEEKLRGLVPESFETYQIVEPGDIIIRSTDMQNDHTSLRTGLVKDKGIITSAYLCLKSLNPDRSNFNHWQLHGLDLMKVFYGLGSGLRQNLSWKDFKRLGLTIPPIHEQNLISRYLDWQSSKINKFIKAKKKLISLLKEQKQNIINEAVTKGINPDVKMKDSGVEWIGEIPEHWNLRKLKHIAKMKSGDNLTSVEIEEKGQYPVYGGNGIRGYYHRFNRSGSFLLLGRQGALCGNIHRVKGQFWATEHAVVVTLKKDICLNWYYYMLIFMNLNQYSEAAAQPGISAEKIQNLRTTVPPLNEQEQIAKFIEEENSLIDKTITRAEREIELIQEYRTRLISDVVTGKVDVRSIKIPDFEPVEADVEAQEEESEDEPVAEEIEG